MAFLQTDQLSATSFEDRVPHIQFVTETDGTTFTVNIANRITIGRNLHENHPTLDLDTLPDAAHNISRRHAEMTFVNGQLYIQDLHSVTGTYRNGALLAPHQKCRLRNGDRLQFGSTTFTIRITV